MRETQWPCEVRCSLTLLRIVRATCCSVGVDQRTRAGTIFGTVSTTPDVRMYFRKLLQSGNRALFLHSIVERLLHGLRGGLLAQLADAVAGGGGLAASAQSLGVVVFSASSAARPLCGRFPQSPQNDDGASPISS
jgi:hypothetical protein